jgi:hypothetical protein
MDSSDATTGKKIYLNGKLDATGAMTTLFDSTSTAVSIGRAQVFAGAVHYFAGQIDDARIYAGSKTAAEVRAIYADSLDYSRQTLRRWGRSVGKAPATGQIFRSSIFHSAIIRGAA